MRKNMQNKHIIRKTELWPDNKPKHSKFCQKDNDRCLAVGILILIITALVVFNSFQFARMIKLDRMTKAIEAEIASAEIN